MRRSTIFAVLLAFLLLAFQSTPRLSAQAAPGMFSDANHPAGAPDPQKADDVWNVDPINDQVSIRIPFLTTPQGGRGPKLPFSLLYNSGSTVTLQSGGTVFVGYGGTVTWFKWSAQPLAAVTSPTGPWTTSGPYFYSSSSVIPDMGFTDTNGSYHKTANGCTIDSPYNYVDQDGGSHDMNLVSFSAIGADQNLGWAPPCGPAQSASTTYWPNSSTTDGSALYTASGTVIYPDGTGAAGTFTVSGAPGSLATLTDANGNYATLNTASGVTTATDSLGRTAYKTNIPVGQPGQIPAGSYYVSTYNAAGSAQNYTVTFSTLAIAAFTMPHPTNAEILSPLFCTSNCTSNWTVNQASAGDTFTAVTEIDLPNGTFYKFAYDRHTARFPRLLFPPVDTCGLCGAFATRTGVLIANTKPFLRS